jgi:hypothetical protein
MRVVAVLTLASAIVLRTELDPYCKKGIVNTAMTVCCMKSCGECDDLSQICTDNQTAGVGDAFIHGKNCCPTIMLEQRAGDPPLKSCEFSVAPCKIPVEVRNPPSIAKLTRSERHAKEDCGDAVQEAHNNNDVSTHFVKFPMSDLADSSQYSTSDCGNYGTLAQVAAACSHEETCMGFRTDSEDAPECLLVAGSEIAEMQSGSDMTLYLKRAVGLTHETYEMVATPVGNCSAPCDGGVQTRTIACQTSVGMEVPLGMCSTSVALNADALLNETVPCNTHGCSVHVSNSTF